MRRKIAATAVVGLLALGAGVAYAATQAGGTNTCVNDTNGLIRVADTCRDGEHPLTIGGGGGGNAVATQNGVFRLAADATGGAKTLPLTGVTISGKCETFTLPFSTGTGLNARPIIQAPTGKTMDLFPGEFGNSPLGVTSRLLPPVASFVPGIGVSYSVVPPTVLTANGATATIAFGAYADGNAQTCSFLWHAVESPN